MFFPKLNSVIRLPRNSPLKHSDSQLLIIRHKTLKYIQTRYLAFFPISGTQLPSKYNSSICRYDLQKTGKWPLEKPNLNGPSIVILPDKALRFNVWHKMGNNTVI